MLVILTKEQSTWQLAAYLLSEVDKLLTATCPEANTRLSQEKLTSIQSKARPGSAESKTRKHRYYTVV